MTATHHLLLSSRYCLAVTNPRFHGSRACSQSNSNHGPVTLAVTGPFFFWLLDSGQEVAPESRATEAVVFRLKT